MAITALEVAWAGWVITGVGWFLSPIIALLLPWIISHLGFDLSQKLRQLKIQIIPELENTLRAVEEARIMTQSGEETNVSTTLDNMAAMLRHAREDAEDIFDDAQETELYRNRWPQPLYGDVKARIAVGYGAVEACIARCLGFLQKQLDKLADKVGRPLDGVVATCKSSCMRLLVWAQKINLLRPYGAVKSSMWIALQWPRKIVARCWHGLCCAIYNLWLASITRSGVVARLLQWPRRMRGPQNVLPVTTNADIPDVVAPDIPLATNAVASDQQIPADYFHGAVSDQQDPVTTPTTTAVAASDRQAPVTTTPDADLVTTGAATSDEPPVPVSAPSDSPGWWLSCWCSFVEFMENGIVFVFGFACLIRDRPYEWMNIKSDKEKATALDSVLQTIARSQLKKTIDDIHNTVSDVKKSRLIKSRLIVEASKTAMDDIANENRSRIITAIDHKVFGREALRKSIMAKLKETPPSSSTSRCYSAIGIYGVAGSGKTTFARYTRDYIEEECKEEKLFDTIMCIHVSKIFSVDDIFHEMLKDITEDGHYNISDRKELEKKLKESLSGKRFFLILDDLWVKTTTDSKLRELIAPLNVGLKGSKILVTARTKVAAGVLCSDEPIEMCDLDKDEYLSMFMHYARGCKSVIEEEFTQVGSVIAEKLHRSPIAAVIVAGQLGANQDINFWKNTAKHEMVNGTKGALWWSYQQLNPDIRRYFEYCNLFPRRFRMKKDDLVHLWTAQGFVKTSDATKEMEDVAERYIQDLVSYSFLQPAKTRNGQVAFRIHDLLHDLADMVAGTDFFTIENRINKTGESWKGDVPRDVRHLFIQKYDAKLITEKTHGLRNLLTLIINVTGEDTKVEEKIIDNICKKLPKLRVLAFYLREYISKDLVGNKIQRKLLVPESVGQLKYLRYFAFRTSRFCKITLPSTLNKLKHIHLLDFGRGEVSEINFAELVSLRHIFCSPHVQKLAYVELSSLRTLPGFEVSTELGCELNQLSDLNKLRGGLLIRGLKNVKSKDEALQAKLAAKARLTELALMWDNDDGTRCSPEVEADVLEGMCPPAGLQKLKLYNFVGCKYPYWMVGKHSGGPKCLQELYLLACSQPVPASGLAEAFPHLRVLRFGACSWDVLPGNMEHLTSLKELEIFLCNNIRLLPTLPQSLEVFGVQFCNDEFRKSCETVGHPNWQKIEHVPQKKFL